MSQKTEIQEAIANMPEDCNAAQEGKPAEEILLPLCSHRAYELLSRSITSLMEKEGQADDVDCYLFQTSDAWEEIQTLFSLEVVREVVVVLAEHLEIPPCDCGETEDPYLCGGVFCQVLQHYFPAPVAH